MIKNRDRMKGMTFSVSYSEEVSDALSSKKAIVALESNVISHGLKYPLNLETALAVEDAVRKSGATPATLFIDKGRVVVGSNEKLLEQFATQKDIIKVSNRDLPIVLAKGVSGATTVASSLICTELAGISFFSSAGVGGVHRGAATSMDISADLIQITRSRVAIVCAGVKNILDLPLTLEFLETHGIPLLSYKCDDFPAFYCASSGLPSPHRIDDAMVVAKAIDLHWATSVGGGVLITTPPKEEDSVAKEDVEEALSVAIKNAEKNGVQGNKLTKFLMHAIDEATGGKTSIANQAVLISTAETAGLLSVAYCKYNREI